MKPFEADLPDELQGGRQRVAAPQADDQQEQLAALGAAIANKREQAVSARKESGIEEVWRACEDAYQCIDDANRHEYAGAKWLKPTSMTGPVTTPRSPTRDDTKSTAFVPLTRRYVDMGVAKITEIALPIDDKAFSLKATPIPELVDQQDSTDPAVHPLTGQPAPPMPGPDGKPIPLTMGDVAKAVEETASDCAKKAEKRIWDWMVECGYPSEMRTVLHDSARIGFGVIKGPFPYMQTSKALSKQGNAAKLTIVQKSVPAAKWIDAWNLFPDGACGEDIHSGDYIFERDFIARSTLKSLKEVTDSLGAPVYLSQQIDKVLAEGPEKCNLDSANPNEKVNKDHYTIWYFTGTLKRSDMMLTGAVGLEELPDELDDVYAVVTLVNDTVIRATVNPLESGDFPYRGFPWSRRAGHWAGVGIAEQVSLPQRIVNAATRGWLNNAGISAGPIIVMNQQALRPADGTDVITPLKVYLTTGDAPEGVDVKNFLATIDIPNRGQELQAIVEYGFKLAEEASNIPLLSQGQSSDQTPDTFGQSELQDNNANALLRSQGLRLDDCITEPLVNGFYEFLLLDPDVPDDEKGDFKIIANGTIAMVEKAIQEKVVMGAVQMALNPAYGCDPAKAMEQWLRGKRLDPRDFQYTDQQKQEMAAKPPPEAPQVTAAKITAAATLERAKMDGDRDTEFQRALDQRATIESKAAEDQLNLKRELEKYKVDQQTALGLRKLEQDNEALKVQLAEKTLELQTQKELSTQALAVDVHKHHNPTPEPAPNVLTPPTEPVGRAPAGEAFAA